MESIEHKNQHDAAAGKDRLVTLDLIRFAAAMAVMLCHYTTSYMRGADAPRELPFPILGMIFKYGYLGVNAFFVVSGFVILMTARNRGPAGFTVSRAIRLYPAYWFCVTLAYVVTVWHGTASFDAFLANLTMLQSFIGVPHLQGLYWTLTIELQFYALVFAVLVFGQIHRAGPLLGLWLLACVLMDFVPVPNVVKSLLVQDWAHYFIAGAVFYLIWEEGVTKYRLALLFVCYLQALRHAYWSIMAAATRATGAFLATVSSTDVAVLFAVISAIFVCFLLLALHWLNVRRPIYVLLGSLTYPLYLVHETVAGFILYTGRGLAGSIPALMVSSMTALGAAYLIHRLVERPFAPVFKSWLLGFFVRFKRLAVRRSA